MSLESNIIFRIGSKLGPGGFASLKAGIDMLGSMLKNVKDNIKELDQFAQAWQRANKQAVLMADTAAAGLIDTGAIIKQHNALMRSGVKLTDEQFKTIAVRTVELAQATGEDATAAFERLTKSIQTGSTRALREYGVDLKTSGTLTDRQNEAVKQLTKGFEGMTVSAETTSERLFALENNLGTFQGLLWDATASNETFANALDSINGALGEFNTMLAESPQAMNEFILSAENLKAVFSEVGNVIVESVMSPFVEIEKWINEKMGITGAGVLEQWVQELQRTYADISRNVWEQQITAVDAEREARAEAGVGGGRFIRPSGGGRGGGGGGITDDDLISGFGERDAQIAEEAAFFEELFAVSEEARLREAEAEQARIEQSTEWQTEYFAFLDELEEEASFKKENRFALMIGAERKYIEASKKQWDSGLQGKAELMGQFFGSVSQLMNTESEKLFNIGKAAAIAEGLVNTFLGAIKAVQSFSGLGPWGVAAGWVAAAAITTAGLANVKRISQQQFKGGGSAASVTTPTIGSGSPGITPAVPTGATQNTTSIDRQEVTVNIVMQDEGAGLFDVVMTQNENASKDGRTSLMTSAR
jgi:hypothetical protein